MEELTTMVLEAEELPEEALPEEPASPTRPFAKRIAENLKKNEAKLFAEHPVLSYNLAMAHSACRAQGIVFPEKKAKTDMLLRNFLDLLQKGDRVKFLAWYVEKYEDEKEKELNGHWTRYWKNQNSYY